LIVDLGSRRWHLRGWRPYLWRLHAAVGAGGAMGEAFKPDVPPVTAAVPGSAQAALRSAGWVKDWNVGLNSLGCEWAEHRHWEFFTDLPAGQVPAGDPAIVHAEGLDYAGWVLVDGAVAGEFRGALVRHRFDLTKQLSDAEAHRLSFIFESVPPEQGQIGFTSRSRYFKPRYNYGWDWCPRLVPVGVWDALTLVTGRTPADLVRVRTELADDLTTGRVTVTVDSHVEGAEATVILSDPPGGTPGPFTGIVDQPLRPGTNTLSFEVRNVRPWFPNGLGEPALYSLSVKVAEATCANTLSYDTPVGFKRVRWLPCEGAPPSAAPWLCEVNGQPVFLQGVNWTPTALDYHSAEDSAYRTLINLYKEMGCNVLRVWGGAFLEKEIFWRLCDEAGLLVWQEFPLSSSGLDNYAPEDPAAIADLCAIATDYIRRRGHHVCKLLWCGGNELDDRRADGVTTTGGGRPLDLSHPCLAALAKVVESEDPGTRFIPASPSGPSFLADANDFGKGLHYDVHGPWRIEHVGRTLADWESYWQRDDALFRSEVGQPGAASVELIETYRGDHPAWPPDESNPWWLHSSSWWLQFEQFKGELTGLSEADAIRRYVELSQRLQADALAAAARACKGRFPRCGGFIVWMGHDAYPCPANTSVIDFDRRPKPAYVALKRVFR
jgi:beta-mannosidase